MSGNPDRLSARRLAIGALFLMACGNGGQVVGRFLDAAEAAIYQGTEECAGISAVPPRITFVPPVLCDFQKADENPCCIEKDNVAGRYFENGLVELPDAVDSGCRYGDLR